MVRNSLWFTFLTLTALTQPTLAEAPKAAKPASITSRTTGLYPSKACKVKVKPVEGGDPLLSCPGLPGYSVEISFSAIDIHVVVQGAGWGLSIDGQVGDKLEWRLAGGVPFAVLVAVADSVENDDGTRKNINKRVLVRGLPGFDSVTGVVEDKGDGWKKARELADGLYREQTAPPKKK
jgi:hypothetical protein